VWFPLHSDEMDGTSTERGRSREEDKELALRTARLDPRYYHADPSLHPSEAWVYRQVMERPGGPASAWK
jgi:hypothetical protein